MVTVPTEAAHNADLVHDLVAGGMDVMRINCAHDDAGAWARMISNLERARSKVGRDCRVLMDIAGPKLRTGPMAPGPRVLKWRPKRNASGQVTAPAQIWLHPLDRGDGRPPAADAALPVPEQWLSHLRAGDRIDFTDLRGKARRLRITRRQEGGCWAEAVQTAYVGPETALRHRGAKGQEEARVAAEVLVGDLPPLSQPILLKEGDTLLLTRALTPGRQAVPDEAGQIAEPARIGCTLPEVFTQVKAGERIWFDDGKLGGIVETVGDDGMEVKITHAGERGARLGADKGINLPETKLVLPPLTPKDLEDLSFISAHADLLGLSFVRRAEDVREVESRLVKMAERDMGLILKIETRHGFEQLPQLLLAAFASRPVGIMIARGDLAVECGYERLAEVQEEILWVCEAAHVPVIWATQVLENLTKTGMPSRAEISDAAMAGRAECVMLNKGPHIVEAVRALDDILVRMQAHQRKKTPRLRSLRLSEVLR
jgi:pyruvate kinase